MPVNVVSLLTTLTGSECYLDDVCDTIGVRDVLTLMYQRHVDFAEHSRDEWLMVDVYIRELVGARVYDKSTGKLSLSMQSTGWSYHFLIFAALSEGSRSALN